MTPTTRATVSSRGRSRGSATAGTMPGTRSATKPASTARRVRRILITGGAGFLGVNAADHMVGAGWHVTVLDNLSRAGTERNLKWLTSRHTRATTFVKEDIRNAQTLAEHVKNQEAILA